jgi:hypothetical protein
MARTQAGDDDVAVQAAEDPPAHVAAAPVVKAAGPHPEDPYADPPKTPKPAADTTPDPWDDTAGNGDDRDVATLVELADTSAALAEHANWADIEVPLAPYHKLVEGVRP